MDIVQEALSNSRTIAVIGISDKSWRASHYVARYLQQEGYNIVPVNPNIDEVLRERAYSDLLSIPESIDMVDVFRRSEFVCPIVDEAIEIGERYV